MTQYIPKSEVVTEIEKKLQDLIACKENTSFTEHKVVLWAKIDMCKEILSFLNTIEAKKVDLNKEIDNELETRWRGEYLYANKFRESAKYFYELGLKAQKGE